MLNDTGVVARKPLSGEIWHYGPTLGTLMRQGSTATEGRILHEIPLEDSPGAGRWTGPTRSTWSSDKRIQFVNSRLRSVLVKYEDTQVSHQVYSPQSAINDWESGYYPSPSQTIGGHTVTPEANGTLLTTYWKSGIATSRSVSNGSPPEDSPVERMQTFTCSITGVIVRIDRTGRLLFSRMD